MHSSQWMDWCQLTWYESLLLYIHGKLHLPSKPNSSCQEITLPFKYPSTNKPSSVESRTSIVRAIKEILLWTCYSMKCIPYISLSQSELHNMRCAHFLKRHCWCSIFSFTTLCPFGDLFICYDKLQAAFIRDEEADEHQSSRPITTR